MSSAQVCGSMPSTNRFGSKPGLGDEGQHPAGARLDRHQRAAALAERVLGHLLQADVERQREVVARLRGAARERADAAPGGVDLDLLEAGGAVQLVLVARLDAGAADEVGAAVVGVGSFLLEARLVVLVDAAHVADGVRGDVAVRVLAEQARLDLHALVAEAVHREARHLLVGEPGADRHAFGIARLDHHLLEAGAVARRDLDQLGQLVDGALDAPHPAREDLERVARVVARDDDAVAVDDQAAVGRDRHDRDAVVLGLRGVDVVLDHLQEDEARDRAGRTR